VSVPDSLSDGEDKPELPADAVPVRIRRAPRYRAFVLVGAILGLITGGVTSIVLGGGPGSFSPATLTGYVGVIGLLLGGLLGGAVAVLVERPRSRRVWETRGRGSR
jgi:hypothetical protein